VFCAASRGHSHNHLFAVLHWSTVMPLELFRACELRTSSQACRTCPHHRQNMRSPPLRNLKYSISIQHRCDALMNMNSFQSVENFKLFNSTENHHALILSNNFTIRQRSGALILGQYRFLKSKSGLSVHWKLWMHLGPQSLQN